MVYLYATLITTIALFIRYIDLFGPEFPIYLSPDGQRYMGMANNIDQPRPFCHRFLLPEIFRTPRKWQIFTYSSLIALGPALAYFIDGTIEQKLFGVALMVGLTGVFRINVLYPVLVDAPAMLLVVLMAALIKHHNWVLAYSLLIFAAGIKESTPIFIFLLAQNWWWALGILVSVALNYQYRNKPKVESGIKVGLAAHKGYWFSASEMLLPWGMCLLVVFNMNWWVFAIIGVSYGQLLIANDRARLYQWAFPAVINAVVPIIPVEWMIPVLLIHYFHPFQVKV